MPRDDVRPPGVVGLGRVSGTEVQVSVSCLLVVALIAAVFAPRADSLVPGPDARAWLVGAGVGVLVYVAALVHEAAHAAVARRHRHDVPWIRLVAAGGRTRVVGESSTPGEEAATAAAGPAVSLVIGVLALGGRLTVEVGVVALLLEAVVVANLLIGLLDLLPSPPLDGGRVVRAAAWRVVGSRARGALVAAWTGRATAAALVLVPVTWLGAGGRPGASVWVVCVGVATLTWLASTAELGFNRFRLRAEGLSVADAMRPSTSPDAGSGGSGDLPTVPYDAPLDAVLTTLVQHPDADHLVVDERGVVRGLLSLADVDRVAGGTRRSSPGSQTEYGSAGAGEQ